MTKRLYILRHAQAANAMDQVDIDRPLSEYGVKQAQAIGAYLDNIDLVLCSAATRTRQTLTEAIKYHDVIDNIKYLDELYCASTETLMRAVQDVEDAKNILILAHNPGIFQFAFTVAKDEDNTEYGKLISGYPPCSLSVLECPIDDWSALKDGQNKLAKFIRGDSILSE